MLISVEVMESTDVFGVWLGPEFDSDVIKR